MKPMIDQITDSKKSWTVFKVYLLIASLVGLIGFLVSLGIALTAVGQKLIITDAEYVNGRMFYEMENCKYSKNPMPTDIKEGTSTTPTKEEIATCQEDTKSRIILSRSVDLKENLIGGFVRAVLFGFLFFYHYPKFRKENHG